MASAFDVRVYHSDTLAHNCNRRKRYYIQLYQYVNSYSMFGDLFTSNLSVQCTLHRMSNFNWNRIVRAFVFARMCRASDTLRNTLIWNAFSFFSIRSRSPHLVQHRNPFGNNATMECASWMVTTIADETDLSSELFRSSNSRARKKNEKGQKRDEIWCDENEVCYMRSFRLVFGRKLKSVFLVRSADRGRYPKWIRDICHELGH